jgi:hypothetical protein
MKKIPVDEQAKAERIQYDIDYGDVIPTAETVASATATHTPPSGSATTPTVGVIANGIVPVVFGTLAVTGTHYLDVVATTTPGTQKYAVRLVIPVNM